MCVGIVQSSAASLARRGDVGRLAERRTMRRPLASQSRAALSAMVSSTDWRSVGGEAMTRSTSAVAVCCSSASVTSRLLACLPSSSNSRAFSMAMTAWSANVSSRAICASVNGARHRMHGEDADRPRRRGAAARTSWSAAACAADVGIADSSAMLRRTSGMWIVRRSTRRGQPAIARSHRQPRSRSELPHGGAPCGASATTSAPSRVR